MWGWILGIIGGLVLIMIIIKLATRKSGSGYSDGNIWDRARNVGRGACKKFKDKLFGC